MRSLDQCVYLFENADSDHHFIIAPNPAKDKITIFRHNKFPEEITIGHFNMMGEQVMFDKFQNQTQVEMDVSTLTNGIYLVKLQTSPGIEIKKLVIQ